MLTAKQLGQGRYDNTTNNTVYTVPASTTAHLSSIRICNTTDGAVTARLFLVPSAGSATEATAILYDYSIPANSFHQDNTQHKVLTGGTVVFQNGTANGLTITISGFEEA